MALSLGDFALPTGRRIICMGIVPVADPIPSNGELQASDPIVPTAGALILPGFPPGVFPSYRVARIRSSTSTSARTWGADSPYASEWDTFGPGSHYSGINVQMHIQTEDGSFATLNISPDSVEHEDFTRWDTIVNHSVPVIEAGGEFLLVFTSAGDQSSVDEDVSISYSSGTPTFSASPEIAIFLNRDASLSAEAGSPSFSVSAVSATISNRDTSLSADAGSPTFSVLPQNQQVITGGVGPTGYQFFIDLVESDHSDLQAGVSNRVPDSISSSPGSNTELVGIVEFSGIDETGITIDRTALGDIYSNKGILGISEFTSITLKGYIENQSDGSLVPSSAAARLGRAAKFPWYPARNLRVRHVSGFEEQIKVIIAKSRMVPSTDDRLMYEVTLEPAVVEEDDFVTAGI